MRVPMPLMCTSFEPGQMNAAIASITDEDSRAIAQAEAFLYCGKEKEAVETAQPYLDFEDPALRYSACLICGYANIGLNDIPEARACLSVLIDKNNADEDPVTRAAHILFALAASVLLHLPSPYTREDFFPYAALLPEGLRLFASYILSHAFYLHTEYGRCVGSAENALIMKQGSYPIAELFLLLVTAMGYINLKEIDHAKRSFGVAWEIAHADDLIEPIGMHHGLLQGLIEISLKQLQPAEFARIIDITYRFSYGWRRIHNPVSGEDVADDLTTTEFTIAMLACRNWTNTEIAQHMGISAGTVKNRLSSVYSKLGISSRAELSPRMLR